MTDSTVPPTPSECGGPPATGGSPTQCLLHEEPLAYSLSWRSLVLPHLWIPPWIPNSWDPNSPLTGLLSPSPARKGEIPYPAATLICWSPGTECFPVLRVLIPQTQIPTSPRSALRYNTPQVDFWNLTTLVPKSTSQNPLSHPGDKKPLMLCPSH